MAIGHYRLGKEYMRCLQFSLDSVFTGIGRFLAGGLRMASHLDGLNLFGSILYFFMSLLRVVRG